MSSGIVKDMVPELIERIAKNPEIRVEEVLKDMETISEDEIRKIVKKIISGKREILEMHNPEKVYMGLVMKEIRGRAPGAVVMKIVAEEVRKAGSG